MDLTELTDRLLIAETLHAYCDLVDRSELDELLRLFTTDAVLDMGRGSTATGQAALRPLVRERIARWATTSHHCSTTVLLRYDGTTATTTSRVYVLHEAPERDERLHLWGRYDDELARTGDSWLVHRRTFRVAAVHRTTCCPLPDRFEPFPRTPLPGT